MGQNSSSMEVADKVRGLGAVYESVAEAIVRFDMSGQFLIEAAVFEISDFLVSRYPGLDNVQRQRLLYELDCLKRREDASTWVSDSENEEEDEYPPFKKRNIVTPRNSVDEKWKRHGSKYIGAQLERKVYDGPKLVHRRGLVVEYCAPKDSLFKNAQGESVALWRAQFQGLNETIELEESELLKALTKERKKLNNRQRISREEGGHYKSFYSSKSRSCAVRARQLALPMKKVEEERRGSVVSPTPSEHCFGTVTRRSSNASLVSISEESLLCCVTSDLHYKDEAIKKRKREDALVIENAHSLVTIKNKFPQMKQIHATKTNLLQSLNPFLSAQNELDSEIMIFDHFLLQASSSEEKIPLPIKERISNDIPPPKKKRGRPPLSTRQIPKKEVPGTDNKKRMKRTLAGKRMCQGCRSSPCLGTQLDCFVGIQIHNGKYVARGDTYRFESAAEAARRFDLLYPTEACNFTSKRVVTKEATQEAPDGDFVPGTIITDAASKKWYIANDEDTLVSICKKNGNLNAHAALSANLNCSHFRTKGPKLSLRAKLKKNTRVLLSF